MDRVDNKGAIMQDWVDKLPPIILAIMGGIAEFLMSDDHSWTNILISMFLAGFAGYLTLLICIEYSVSEGMTGVACGIGGMSSRAVLALFKRAVIDKLKAYLNADDEDDKDDKDGKK